MISVNSFHHHQTHEWMKESPFDVHFIGNLHRTEQSLKVFQRIWYLIYFKATPCSVPLKGIFYQMDDNGCSLHYFVSLMMVKLVYSNQSPFRLVVFTKNKCSYLAHVGDERHMVSWNKADTRPLGRMCIVQFGGKARCGSSTLFQG